MQGSSFHCGILLFVCFSTAAAPVTAQESPLAKSTSILQVRLEQLARSFPGKIGIFARNVETGAEVGFNADEFFPMASTYKVPIMVQVFREVDAGHLSLDQRITISEGDRRLGSGILTHATPGLNPSLYDLLFMMITLSDNEATDLLVKRVGAAQVTATMRHFGIQNMRVDRTTEEVIRDWLAAADPTFRGASAASVLANPSAFQKLTREESEEADLAFLKDPRDQASPRAMTDLLTKIFRSEAASEKSCRDMLTIMQQQQFRGRIGRYLENVTVASKTGTIGYVTDDVGIIYAGKQHIAVSVFTVKANTKVTTEEAEERIGRIARTIYDYFQDESLPQ